MMKSLISFVVMCLLMTSKANHKHQAWNKPAYTDAPSTTAPSIATTTSTPTTTTPTTFTSTPTHEPTPYGGQKPYQYSKKKEDCYPGIIKGWFGKRSKIPDGYQLCDGTNGTPNLRDVFPMGAGAVFPFGTTGGATSIHLSVDQLPSHSHDAGTLSATTAGAHLHSFSTEVLASGAHTHNVSDFAVSDAVDHVHGFKTRTDDAGAHSHSFGSFFEADYDTYKKNEDFDIPLDKIDTAKSYTVDTSKDGKHRHNIVGDTESGGSHTHTVTGTVGGDGLHTHTVSGVVDSAGDHMHGLSGSTGSVGAGEAIDIINPFRAIRYICCVERSYDGHGYGNPNLSYND